MHLWKFLLIVGFEASLAQHHGGNSDVTQKIVKSCLMRDTICVGEPKNCYYQSPANCNLMVAITTTHNKYYFELFGVQEKSDPGQSKEFVAVGLSKMGVKLANASIVQCSQQDQIKVRFEQNGDFHHIVGADYVQSAVGSVGAYDGKIVCNFTRNAVSNEHGFNFNLNTDEYFVSLIHGYERDENGHSNWIKDKISVHTTDEQISITTKSSAPNKGHSTMLGIGVLSIVILFYGSDFVAGAGW